MQRHAVRVLQVIGHAELGFQIFVIAGEAARDPRSAALLRASIAEMQPRFEDAPIGLAPRRELPPGNEGFKVRVAYRPAH